MAEPRYEHEEIAPQPRGWRVGTVLSDGHQIRIAFPPGPRRRGAGRVISILHPRGENPAAHAGKWVVIYCPSETPAYRVIQASQYGAELQAAGCKAVYRTGSQHTAQQMADRLTDLTGKIGIGPLYPTKWGGKNPEPFTQMMYKGFRVAFEMASSYRLGRNYWNYTITRDDRLMHNEMSNTDLATLEQAQAHARAKIDGFIAGRGWFSNPLESKTIYKWQYKPVGGTQWRDGSGERFVAVADAQNAAQLAISTQPKFGPDSAGAYEFRIVTIHTPGPSTAVPQWVQVGQTWSNPSYSFSQEQYDKAIKWIEKAGYRAGIDFTEDVAGGVVRLITLNKEVAHTIAKAWRKVRRGNPAEDLDQAADLYRKFHGKDPSEVLQVQESDAARGEFTSLGDMVELIVKTPGKEQYRLGFKGAGVKLASSPDGRQLYLIGGDQAFADAQLRQLGTDAAKDLVDLGEAQAVVYQAAKDFTNFTPTEWNHRFGEDSGRRPRAFYDKLKRRIFLLGGTYRVERPGIVD